MNLRRRTLAGLLACASILALPATAGAATTGLNLSEISNNGDPFVNHPGNVIGVDPSDAPQAWRDIEESGAGQVRTFVQWNNLQGADKLFELERFRQFTTKARARGLSVLLTVTGHANSMATPAAYATVARELATYLRGNGVAYEVWNEPDEKDFWANGPQPAAYADLLKAGYAAFKAGDPDATVLVGGLVGNNYEFVEALYDHGAKGHFDAVAVHTDTACLTTDPREYYREPNGRIGRYSFTGYREVRRTMLAHGDDKPIWMTELGWSTTTAQCARGARAGTKPGGVSYAEQADFLAKAYSCMANDPYLQTAAWFNLHDLESVSTFDPYQLGLIKDDFTRKPAYAAFQRARGATGIECGGTVDTGTPQVRFAFPTDGAQYLTTLPIDIRATDDQGVTDIDLLVDGREIPLRTVRSGSGARVSFEWGGAKDLAWGHHQLVARASDEGKNVGTARIQVTHVGGGAFKLKVPTALRFKVGKVRSGGRVRVSGKVLPKGTVIAPKANGSVWIRFFRKQGGRWKKVSLYRKDAKRAFAFTHKLKSRGRWKVTAVYMPKAGFRGSRARGVSLRF